MRKADIFTTFVCLCLEILEASTSWSPEGLSSPAWGLLYLYCWNTGNVISNPIRGMYVCTSVSCSADNGLANVRYPNITCRASHKLSLYKRTNRGNGRFQPRVSLKQTSLFCVCCSRSVYYDELTNVYIRKQWKTLPTKCTLSFISLFYTNSLLLDHKNNGKNITNKMHIMFHLSVLC
jgi:hypothetical protein